MLVHLHRGEAEPVELRTTVEHGKAFPRQCVGTYDSFPVHIAS